MSDNLKAKPHFGTNMGRAVAKARKIGGSLMVTIPKELVEQEDIREGELVELEVRKAKRSFFGIDPGIGPMRKEDELDTHL